MLQFSIAFPWTEPLPRVASFDLDAATPDGGLVWIAEADRQFGLCAAAEGRFVPRHTPLAWCLV